MIEIYQLSLRFGKKQIFHRFNATIEDRGITLIDGDSGAGKTTLLRCLVNEIRFGGKIAIDGKFYRGNDAISSKKISYAPANFVLDPNEEVWTMFHAYLSKEECGIAMNYFDRYEINSLLHERFSDLSVGQRSLIQTVFFLSKKADYYFLDEPTASLDQKKISLLEEDIKRIAEDESVVLISHDRRMKLLYDKRIDLSVSEETEEIRGEQYRGEKVSFQRLNFGKTNLQKVFLSVAMLFPLLFSLTVATVQKYGSYGFKSFPDEYIVLTEEKTFQREVYIDDVGKILDNVADLYAIPKRRCVSSGYEFFYNDFYSIDLSDSALYGAKQHGMFCTYTPRVGLNGKKIERPYEAMISTPVYEYLKKNFSKAGVSIAPEQLSFNSFRVVDCFESDDFEVNFSWDNLYDDLYNCKTYIDIYSELPQGKTDLQKIYLSEDLLTEKINFKLPFLKNDWSFEIVSGYREIFIPDEEKYEKVKETIASSVSSLSYLPAPSDLMLREGHAPADAREIVLSNALRDTEIEENLKMKGYAVAGYTEENLFYPYVAKIYMTPGEAFRKSNLNVREVLFSGGDPMTVSQQSGYFVWSASAWAKLSDRSIRFPIVTGGLSFMGLIDLGYLFFFVNETRKRYELYYVIGADRRNIRENYLRLFARFVLLFGAALLAFFVLMFYRLKFLYVSSVLFEVIAVLLPFLFLETVLILILGGAILFRKRKLW